MDLDSNFFTNLGIVGGGILFALIIMVLLSLYQAKKISKLVEKNRKLLDISSYLIDHPVMIISDQFQIICANTLMHKYMQVMRGDSLRDTATLPFLCIKDEWKSLSHILEMYREESVDNILFIADAFIRTKERDRPVNIRITGTNSKDKIEYFGFAIFDISDSLKLSKIHYQNTASGLPNHNKAIADIGLVASNISSPKQKFAVSVIRIDNFLEIISAIGYDEALSTVSLIAKYLQKVSLQNKLHLYHLTRNDFLLILPNIHSIHETRLLVDKYKDNCEQLLHNQNTNLHFTLSAGISIFPDNSIGNLINSAYKALLFAHKQGLGYTIVADPDRRRKKADPAIEYREIKNALESEQFCLYYQPIYNVSTRRIAAAEALIRWNHPVKGLITPFHFLPLVEKTGFMKSLSEYVARDAIKQLATWNALGFKKVQVSINLSMREFEAGNYHKMLETLLKKSKVDASQLKVEITENIAMANEEYSLMQLTKLQEIGIQISLDDFGTGYSSFSMLESFPITTLKIDKSFVMDMIQNKDHYAIVKAMIAMTHALDIKVIAEGIENKQTAALLEELECDYLQGYYFGKPMPTFEFQELIRSEQQKLNTGDILELEEI